MSANAKGLVGKFASVNYTTSTGLSQIATTYIADNHGFYVENTRGVRARLDSTVPGKRGQVAFYCQKEVVAPVPFISVGSANPTVRRADPGSQNPFKIAPNTIFADDSMRVKGTMLCDRVVTRQISADGQLSYCDIHAALSAVRSDVAAMVNMADVQLLDLAGRVASIETAVRGLAIQNESGDPDCKIVLTSSLSLALRRPGQPDLVAVSFVDNSTAHPLVIHDEAPLPNTFDTEPPVMAALPDDQFDISKATDAMEPPSPAVVFVPSITHGLPASPLLSKSTMDNFAAQIASTAPAVLLKVPDRTIAMATDSFTFHDSLIQGMSPIETEASQEPQPASHSYVDAIPTADLPVTPSKPRLHTSKKKKRSVAL